MENLEKQSTKKSYKGLSIFLALLCLCLVIALFYLAGRISDLRENISNNYEQIADQETEIKLQEGKINDLIAKYEDLKVERDSLGLSNDALEKKISGLNSYLSSVKKKNTLAEQDIKEYQALLAEYEEDIKLRDQQLEQLKLAYDTLQSTSELQKVEMEMMSEHMDNLEDKVQIASILRAEDVVIKVVNSKGKEYEGGEYKDKWVDKVKVMMTIADNKVAEKGPKEIFMKLVEPSGSTLSNGGTFVDAEGETRPYTLRQVVDFNNTLQRVQYTYDKGSEYAEGTYKVEFYSEGHMIGKGSFIVK